MRVIMYDDWCPIPCKSNVILVRTGSLQWRHNGRDGPSNHQPHHCLLNHLFRSRSKKTSKFRDTGLCAGNSPLTGEFPHKWPVTRKMFPFDDVIMFIWWIKKITLVFSILPQHWHAVGYLHYWQWRHCIELKNICISQSQYHGWYDTSSHGIRLFLFYDSNFSSKFTNEHA